MKNVPCPGIVVNHAEICPRGRRLSLFLSLSLFKKRERDRERPVVVERCHALPPPPTCKGRLVRVFNVVLDRAKNVRAIRKLHTWMRGDSRCSIYVTCNWPGGEGKRHCHTAQLIALEDVATIISKESRGRGGFRSFFF